MSTIADMVKSFEFNRGRTLATLDEIEKLPSPQAALAHRLAPGRAHVAWQFAHIGVTEDIFANYLISTERPGRFADLWPRFRGGSTADDNVPDLATLRKILADSRVGLLESVASMREDELGIVPPNLAEKKWTNLTMLHIIGWHEGHHQGQAHAMLNSFKAHNL
jgi:uncharacterized damage-inducible protein DinB